MTEERKEKYANFLDKVSGILGLNKPIDILRLCAVTDEYFKPIEKRIAELEKENIKLKEEIKNNEDLATVAYMQGAESQKKKTDKQLSKVKVALRKVVDYLGQFCSDYPDCVIEAEQFLKESDNEKA